MIKISYAITVYNELEEVKRLINFLLSRKREQDEIVVLFDNKGTKEVWNYLVETEEKLTLLHRAQFNNDFGQWKNLLTKLCTGDYIFQIDADEIPCAPIMESLPSILESNPEIDVLLVPRVNTVEGLTNEHLIKWRWEVNSEGWVNWPDFQWRIYKNIARIRWINKVHERLEGFRSYTTLPMEEDYSLYHPKTIERQEKQNNYYDTL
jgi:glycosyltransferase involved in cell wall biosynthesis